MKYSGTVSHYGIDGFVELPFTVEADTISKARYRAFVKYKDAFCPVGKNLFKWFLDYVLIKIAKEDTP